DFPGLAKTLIARSFAEVTSMRFTRVQFTPDLMPGDVTGSSIFDQRTSDFEFRPGPIFTNVLLADEINRAPPKTQAALLEGMQERQVTIEGRTHPLERPFLVLATQNPVEYEGTYPLPEAQQDRFLFKAVLGYPTDESELEVLARWDRGIELRDPVKAGVEPVLNAAAVAECNAEVLAVREARALPGGRDIGVEREVPRPFSLGQLETVRLRLRSPQSAGLEAEVADHAPLELSPRPRLLAGRFDPEGGFEVTYQTRPP